MSTENHQSITRVFVSAIKGLLREALKVFTIAIAWCMRLAGMVLTKTGEAIEKIVIKKS